MSTYFRPLIERPAFINWRQQNRSNKTKQIFEVVTNKGGEEDKLDVPNKLGRKQAQGF